MIPTPKFLPPRSRSLLAASLFFGFFLRSAVAQETPARPDEASRPDDSPPTGPVVKLESFKVYSPKLESYAEATGSSATKLPMDLAETPATLQILNAAFLEDKRAQSLEDVFSYVVGMNRENPSASGFTLRGFSGDTTTTMINIIQFDGMPGSASRFGSPTTANVERLEVLKGPASVTFGAMNPGGVVNIISKSPQAKAGYSFSTAVSSYAGQGTSFGQDAGIIGTFDATGPIDANKHWLYRFIASYEDAATWKQFDWSRNYYIYPSLTYRPSKDTEITIKLEFDRQHRFSIQDQALVAPFDLIANVVKDHSLVYQDPNSVEYDRGDVYTLTARHHFQDDWTVQFNSREVQHSDGRRLLENRTVNSAPILDNSTITQRLRDTWNRRRYSYNDIYAFRQFGPESFSNTVLVGASMGYETPSFLRWVFANVTGPEISVYHPVHGLTQYPVYNSADGPTQIATAKYYNYAQYFSDQIKFGKQWQLQLGLRHEKYDMKYTDFALKNGKYINPGAVAHNSASTPSAGVVYQPRDNMSVYASYATSFKPSIPQAVDGYGQPFSPEKANQVEVGAKLGFDNNKFNVLLSVFDITRDNVSEAIPTLFDANGVQLYRQQSEVSRGTELSLNYQPVPHVQMQVGYIYDDTYVSASANPAEVGARLDNAPRHSFNFWGRYNVPAGALRGLGVGLGVIYVGDRNGILINDPAHAMTIPSNTRMDFAVYYRWKRYDFAINVNNVTDLSYIASANANTDVVPGDPRKITASLKYAW
ncbi:MAG: ferrichrome-iron receptor [Verrucomicrobia bacterium]|nr:ferrichrome-iron receptor [Verrucomicrobiota bacterium]